MRKIEVAYGSHIDKVTFFKAEKKTVSNADKARSVIKSVKHTQGCALKVSSDSRKTSAYCDLCQQPGTEYYCYEHNWDICKQCYFEEDGGALEKIRLGKFLHPLTSRENMFDMEQVLQRKYL